ncbi:hypothetical protein BTN49_0477 [Candidatus Enterovibrio escicola]|uniref:Uncharacterized protein n=1 Tax=Candidatus Enterovibrio escicola TaxID=1927127 RepID=A0A2A5T5M8_9GAMM|nr:hypothetical protein BTN49_0477 [Candidatus Enterovibrio escacola]
MPSPYETNDFIQTIKSGLGHLVRFLYVTQVILTSSVKKKAFVNASI